MNSTTPTISLTQVANVIQTTPQLLRSMLAAVEQPVLRWHPAPDEWCINEVIGHLIEADRHAFAERVKIILAQDEPQIKPWSAAGAAAARNDCERDTIELINQLAAARKEYVQLIKGTNPAQLGRTGTYPPHGQFKAADFIYEWAYHDHSHLMQISGIIRASIWPNFSDTMQTALSQ